MLASLHLRRFLVSTGSLLTVNLDFARNYLNLNSSVRQWFRVVDNTSGIGSRLDYRNIALREARGLNLLPDNLGGPPSRSVLARVVPLLDPQLLVRFVRTFMNSADSGTLDHNTIYRLETDFLLRPDWDGRRVVNQSFYNLFNDASLNAAILDTELADTRLTILEWEERAVSVWLGCIVLASRPGADRLGSSLSYNG